MSVTREQMDTLREKFVAAGHIAAPEGEEQQETVDDELQSGEVGSEEQGLEGENQDLQAAEGDEAAEAAAEEGAAAGDQAGDEKDAYTPAELAEAIGWEASDLYNTLQIPLDDGQGTIPLGEFKNKMQDLSRENKQLQTQVEQAQTQQGSFAEAQQVSMEVMQLQSYYNNVEQMEKNTDWAALEEDDPTAAVLKRQKFADVKSEVRQRMQQVQQQQYMAKQQHLQQANTKMLEMIPSWSDDSAKKADQDIIRTHMKTVGFADAEINQIADPRAMALLKELVDLRAKFAAAEGAVNRVRKAPKVLRNSAGRFTRQDGQAERAAKLKDKARRTGRRQDEVDAVKALLSNR